MRIAVSGNHRVGKTELVDALAEALPAHEVVPEPYHQLEEEGYEFVMPHVQQLVPTLDLIVFVPIEEPDRIIVDHSEARLRTRVDAVLSDIVVNDAYCLEVDVLTVRGATAARVRDVLRYLRRVDGSALPDWRRGIGKP